MGRRKRTVPSLKGRKKKRKQPYLVECLQLPGDAVMGMELATICGDRDLTLRSFKQIQAVSSSEIVVAARHHMIRVCGEELELAYYTLEEIKISGRIESVSYEKR